MDAEKNQEPTSKRRADARKRGDIVLSKDLNNALLLLSGALLLMGIGPTMISDIKISIYQFTTLAGKSKSFDCPLIIEHVFATIFRLSMPLLMGIIMTTLLVYGLQTKFGVFEEKLKFSPERLDLIKNLKNMFSLKQATLPLLISAKAFVIIIVGYYTIKPILLSSLAGNPGEASFIHTDLAVNIQTLVFRTILLLIILGAIDYALTWRQHEQQLKMTREEIKEELKQEHGSPEVKRKVRQQMYELSRAMMAKVEEATVVVTNPTTFAVAIKYIRGKTEIPVVVAKGQRLIAQRIREIAKNNQIPIVENRPLARGLYAAVEIGKPIPPQFFQAVASILAYVYGLRGKRKK